MRFFWLKFRGFFLVGEERGLIFVMVAPVKGLYTWLISIYKFSQQMPCLQFYGHCLRSEFITVAGLKRK